MKAIKIIGTALVLTAAVNILAVVVGAITFNDGGLIVMKFGFYGFIACALLVTGLAILEEYLDTKNGGSNDTTKA